MHDVSEEAQPLDQWFFFREVQRLSIAPLPMGSGHGAISPSCSQRLLYFPKPFASSSVRIRIHSCEKMLFLTISVASCSETHTVT
jgi:hypothetical protein